MTDLDIAAQNRLNALLKHLQRTDVRCAECGREIAALPDQRLCGTCEPSKLTSDLFHN